MDNVLHLGYIPVSARYSEYKGKYQHDTFLQPQESKRGGCSQVRESCRYGNGHYRSILDFGISRHILEQGSGGLYRSSGDGYWSGVYSLWADQVQSRHILTNKYPPAKAGGYLSGIQYYFFNAWTAARRASTFSWVVAQLAQKRTPEWVGSVRSQYS